MFFQGFIIFNILWYVFSNILNLKVLPNPISIYMNFTKIKWIILYKHILASLYRIGFGIGISLILGTLIGLLMANSNRWNKILNPLVYFTYPIPKTALLPIVMLLFGLGDSSKIIVIVLIIIFQIIVAVRDGVLSIPPETYNPIKSLGASKIQILIHITLPAILPDILTSMRVSIGTALSILFFTEGYGTKYGIGYFILDAWSRINYLDMYVGILVMSLVGFILFIFIDLLEELICKWK